MQQLLLTRATNYMHAAQRNDKLCTDHRMQLASQGQRPCMASENCVKQHNAPTTAEQRNIDCSQQLQRNTAPNNKLQHETASYNSWRCATAVSHKRRQQPANQVQARAHTHAFSSMKQHHTPIEISCNASGCTFGQQQQQPRWQLHAPRTHVL